jgi:hypothetical protein
MQCQYALHLHLHFSAATAIKSLAIPIPPFRSHGIHTYTTHVHACSAPLPLTPTLSPSYSLFRLLGYVPGLGYHSASLIACLSLRLLSLFLSSTPSHPTSSSSPTASDIFLNLGSLAPLLYPDPSTFAASGFKSFQLPCPRQQTLSQLQPLTGLSQAQNPPSLVDCGLPSPVQRPFSQSRELRRPLEVQDRIRLRP